MASQSRSWVSGARDDRASQGGPGRTLCRGISRSSLPARSVGTEWQGPAPGGPRQFRSLAGAVTQDPIAAESGATNLSRSRQAVRPDQPRMPCISPSRWRSGSDTGCRARRVVASSCQPTRHASPPRAGRMWQRRCLAPPDGLEPSKHILTIPLYPQSYGTQSGIVALLHRGDIAPPCSGLHATPAASSGERRRRVGGRGSARCAARGGFGSRGNMRPRRTAGWACTRSSGRCWRRPRWRRCGSQ